MELSSFMSQLKTYLFASHVPFVEIIYLAVFTYSATLAVCLESAMDSCIFQCACQEMFEYCCTCPLHWILLLFLCDNVERRDTVISFSLLYKSSH